LTSQSERTAKKLIIFDFDGVIADSEMLANTVLAEFITELGVPTAPDDALRLYMGKRSPDLIAAIEVVTGRSLSRAEFSEVQNRTLAAFRQDLKLVEGARDYIEAFAIPRCIASSSSPERLSFCLEILELKHIFGANVFSASQVERGKPHPDIFLYAASRMRIDPAASLVLEDSASGVQAGVAAGMTVIGFLAGSHMREGHAARLREAGAQYVATSFLEAEKITRSLVF
jgi:HAD superfamily hydrolase (TIGR01509 family)